VSADDQFFLGQAILLYLLALSGGIVFERMPERVPVPMVVEKFFAIACFAAAAIGEFRLLFFHTR
jgi:hypothetical protein